MWLLFPVSGREGHWSIVQWSTYQRPCLGQGSTSLLSCWEGHAAKWQDICVVWRSGDHMECGAVWGSIHQLWARYGSPLGNRTWWAAVAVTDQHVLFVCCVFSVGLTALADQLWLQQISMSYVCTVCLVLAWLRLLTSCGCNRSACLMCVLCA